MDERFLLDPFEPAYAGLDFEEKLAAARRELKDCCACPRDCHVDRWNDETGICHTGRYARVASVSPHLGEEDCLRGWNGSGTIFLSLCNLRCVFCQNWDISQTTRGEVCG
ncbi:MAG: radical SAM protein, partial [Planctomycetota bacterium]